MEFTPVGVIADILWHEIPHHASHVRLGNFVVMPNHIHGILILNNPGNLIANDGNENGKDGNRNDGNDGNGNDGDENDGDMGIKNDRDRNDGDGNYRDGNYGDENDGDVQPLHATAPQNEISKDPPKNPQMAAISPKSNSISTIIRSYKSATTKHAHRLGFEFEWQTRFHDIIIRNDGAFQNISKYIKNNPENWKEDNFN